jgi:hypothetical protein
MQTRNPSKREAADLRRGPRDTRNRPKFLYLLKKYSKILNVWRLTLKCSYIFILQILGICEDEFIVCTNFLMVTIEGQVTSAPRCLCMDCTICFNVKTLRSLQADTLKSYRTTLTKNHSFLSSIVYEYFRRLHSQRYLCFWDMWTEFQCVSTKKKKRSTCLKTMQVYPPVRDVVSRTEPYVPFLWNAVYKSFTKLADEAWM